MRNELYHSDKYLGQDFSDGIKHYKYIKREMKNGRWVYYYKDDLTNKAQKNFNRAEKKHLKAFNNVSNVRLKRDNAKRNIKYYDKQSQISSAHKDVAANTYLDAKWYEFSKKNRMKKLGKSYTEDIKSHNKNMNENKADVKKYNKDLKKAKLKSKQADTDYKIAYDELKRAKQKDKGKKAVAKVLVKGLNTAESIKSASKKASKKINKAVNDVSENIKKTSKNIKKDVKSTINNIRDEQRYQEAKIKGYTSYKDTSGRTRLTQVTKSGRESMEKYMKKNSDGSLSMTPKGVKAMEKYRELKAEEDRINSKKKKKKK